MPSSGIQNTSQFNSRNLAHLQNKLLLSLAHSHTGKSVLEQSARRGMQSVHQCVSTDFAGIVSSQMLLSVPWSYKKDTPGGVCLSLTKGVKDRIQTVQNSNKVRIPAHRIVTST